MPKKTPIRTIVAALVAGMMLSAPAQAAEKLTVLLDWFVNPDHAPLVIAKVGGFFARADLDVELVAPSDPSTPPRLVAAKQADIAVSYQPNLMLDLDQGLPLIRFGTLVETPLNSLIVLEDGPVKTLADLKGRKIGYSVAGFEDAYVETLLKSADLTPADVTMVNVNFNLTPALMSGQVDAIIGGYRNFELTELEIDGKPGRAFFPEEHGVPVYDELIYETHKDNRDDPRLAAFIRAVEAATIYLTNHPDEALKLFLEAYPDLNDELNRRAWFDTLPRFAKRPAALDQGRYRRFAEFLKEQGLIKKVPEVADYAIEPR